MRYIEDISNLAERLHSIREAVSDKNITLFSWCEQVDDFACSLFFEDRLNSAVKDSLHFLRNALKTLSNNNKQELKRILNTYDPLVMTTEEEYERAEACINVLTTLAAIFGEEILTMLPENVVDKSQELYEKYFKPSVIETKVN